MKKKVLLLALAGLVLLSFTYFSLEKSYEENPFLVEWDTPFQVPPFDKIKEEHFMPAYLEGMKIEIQEVDDIVNNPAAPTFENTIEAYEATGGLLSKIGNVFGCLNGANTNAELQRISREVSPLRSKHNDDIRLNPKLFERVKAVYEQLEDLDLTAEQNRLLDRIYKGFVRGGANLDENQKARFREINEELSMMTLKFGENVLKEDNAYRIVIDNEEDLAGLPESVISGAAEAAASLGEEGKWVITLHKPSWIPFLTYSEKRELREKIYRGYYMRGDNNNELDNKNLASKIAALRVERANLLGYKTHADFVLENNMSKKAENVYALLNQLWKPALAKSKVEVADMQQMIYDEGNDFKLATWDWWYYAEKVRKAKYDLDDEAIRPYLKLENIIDGAFAVATNLYGITFEARPELPKYHEDVIVYEVKEADGSHIGILYLDYFPRPSKRGGAWMSSLRKQSKKNGKMIHPVIFNVCNLSKPTGDKPALLSFEEVGTLYHEFGHALHGLLSNCTYNALSGTSVPRDFVELPSQIMENWASDPEVIKSYAKHYLTGETIPDELIEKLNNSGTFNMGFVTVEYLAASFLDMDWHTLTEPVEHDAIDFENKSLGRIELIPEIISRYRTSYFRHIFAGGYSSGYYSYIWAEVLDSDAFQAFKETSLYDKATALSFRKNILEKGGTEDPMQMYLNFRGAEPKIDALLKKRGLN